MSEYQYYEFQALDRPLTGREISELRSVSSRATVTATQFVNHYNWGDFKGDPSTWMEKYFDAFLYLANWGTRQFMLRLPRGVLDARTVKQYCCGEAASVRIKGDHILLEFVSQDEDGDWEDDGSGWLSSLIPLRADLAGGDHRLLYLAWLLCVTEGELEDGAAEPPVPPGLSDLTAPLEAFADFLRIDSDLITVAGERSPKAGAPVSGQEIESWIAALPDATKTDWLVRLVGGKEVHLRAEMLRQFGESRPSPPPRLSESPRTVGDLLAAAEQRAEERRRKEAKRAAAERARREREAAEARERYLADLGQREAAAWRKVDELIATKQPARYDEAVTLLCDLRELALRKGSTEVVEAHLRRLCGEHARKPTFMERLRKVGLV